MIKIENLKKYYGKSKGVENISFEVKPGQIYGLIGPNGAGKTTTIRIILGFLNKDSGNILIGNQKIPDDINELKSKIGYLPGEVNYYNDMRVKDFLDYNKRFYKNYDKNYEKEITENLGIDLNKKFRELSMGNKKKIGILQAIIHKPEFLILDEPTNGLDPILQQKLYEIIMKEKERGTTVIFSSHILSEVEKICDLVGIIKDGILIKEFTKEQIGSYSKKIISVKNLKNYKNNSWKISECKDENYIFSIKNSEIKNFLNDINNYEFEDIEIRKPSLEETFMEYYL